MSGATTGPSIGRPMRRTEDPPLLAGRGKYAADVRLPGLLQAAVLRSPHAHARLGAIRAKAALALPGVVAVITAEDLAAIGRIPTRLGHRIGHPECLQFPLTRDRVRYVGEPVAVVIAESRYLAEDALELIDVDYDPLPAVADARRALEPGRPFFTTFWAATWWTGSRPIAAMPLERWPPPPAACGRASRSSATPACRWRRAG